MTHQDTPPSRHAEAEPVAPGAVTARASALLPDQLLQDGEIIVLLIKPHPLYILLAPLKTLTILLLLTVLGVMVDSNANMGETRQAIVAAGVLLIFARLFWQTLEWMSRVYVMTDQRVIAVSGVIRIRIFETSLQHITHSELLFSLRERIFALGSLGFYTAGSAGAEAYWVMINRPLDIHRKVVETLRRYRR